MNTIIFIIFVKNKQLIWITTSLSGDIKIFLKIHLIFPRVQNSSDNDTHHCWRVPHHQVMHPDEEYHIHFKSHWIFQKILIQH